MEALFVSPSVTEPMSDASTPTEQEIEREYENWIRRLIVHRGKLAIIVSLLSIAGTSAGFRWIGPSHDITELRQLSAQKDSVVSARVSRLEDGLTRLADQFRTYEEGQRFQSYMICTLVGQSPAIAPPPGCTTIPRPRGAP